MTTPPSTLPLPDGLTARPLQRGDEQAVFEVMAAEQLAHLGRVEIEEADIVADWLRPSFTVETSTIGVYDEAELIAYAEVGTAGRGDAAVHPRWHGQGIGTALAHWMQRLARERGFDAIGMPVPQGSPGDRLLAALGYQIRWTSWVLHLPPGAQVTDRALPEGYDVREARADEYPAVHSVVDTAFLEWSVRDPEPFADFEAQIMLRPGFEPWQVRVVTDAAGEVVGASIVLIAPTDEGPEAYVSRLATRADQRRRGLAQALLADSFTQARAHGAVRCGLSTDSRTGALELYEKVGMTVTDVWVNRAMALT